MARITVEDCLQKVNNRFGLIHMAAKRVRQLRKGIDPTVTTKNRDVVTALREIAAGTVYRAERIDDQSLPTPEEEKDIISEELPQDSAEPAHEEETEEKKPEESDT